MGATLAKLRRGARSYRGGGFFRTARMAKRMLPKGLRAPSILMGGAVDVGVGTSKGLGRGVARLMGGIARHPWAATATGIAAYGSIGAGRGMTQAAGAIGPTLPMVRPLPTISGPGFTTWSRPPVRVGGPLGATGNISLALYKRRHG